jgi:hypothetical protein
LARQTARLKDIAGWSFIAFGGPQAKAGLSPVLSKLKSAPHHITP